MPPRIPDASALGEIVARTRTPRTIDRSGEIIGRAQQGFAETLGNAADSYAAHDDRFNYARAKSALISETVAAQKELEDDPDFETYEKRFTERMSKAREKATSMIRGRQSRILFDEDAKLDIERGTTEIRGQAKRKEGDWGRAGLQETLQTNRTAALNAKDEPTRAALIQTTADMIEGAAEKGYIDKEASVRLRQSWTADYADGYVSMQPADKRIELLSKPKGTVADHLAPDKRVAMLEQAKNEDRSIRVRRESQSFEDSLVSKYGATTAAREAARDIEDPEVRDSTVSRITTRINEGKAEKAEAHDRLTESALGFIGDGGKFADLPAPIKNSLKPSELRSLQIYAEQLAKPTPIVTDKPTYIELSSLFAEDPQKFGETNMLEYRGSLSDSDFEEFVDLQRKVKSNNIDGKASGFQTIVQIRDDRLREVFGATKAKGAKQEKISHFTSMFESRLASFKEDTGKPAKAAEAKQILDDMTTEVALSGWFKSDKKAFELTDEDVGVPQEDRDLIISGLRKRGLAITDANIQRAYRAAQPKASGKIDRSVAGP